MLFLKIFKKYGLSLFFLIFLCLIFGTYLSHSQENDNSSDVPQVIPFSVPTIRAIPGEEFLIEIQTVLFNEKGEAIPFNKQFENIKVKLQYEIYKEGVKQQPPIEKTISKKNLFFKSLNNKDYLVAIMPSWDDIKEIRTHKPGGILRAYKAKLNVEYKMKTQEKYPPTAEFPIEIPDCRWAVIWGLVAVFGSFFVAWILAYKMKSTSIAKLKTQTIVTRFILFPLRFTITPRGRYSISLTQILLWTYITIFGIVYVYWITGDFLNITSQLLILLGIGGGTALGAKINALSRNARSRPEAIPSKYPDLLIERPQLRNLICIGDELNIFKFQVLVFTLLTGWIVLEEIIQKCVFPEIPGSMLTLMGLSSAVYLGNEVSVEKKAKGNADEDKLWEEVNKKMEAVEKFADSKKVPIENAQQIEAFACKDTGFQKKVDDLRISLKKIYD